MANMAAMECSAIQGEDSFQKKWFMMWGESWHHGFQTLQREADGGSVFFLMDRDW